jgi:hypothetical protein
MSICYSHEGFKENDFFYVKLDFSQSNPGVYELAARIKDDIATETKEVVKTFM